MHVHVHILAYACTCTHTHRQQYEQYHTDSLDRRTKQKGQKPKEAVKSLTTHSRIAPAARLEGVDSGGGGGTIYIYNAPAHAMLHGMALHTHGIYSNSSGQTNKL